MKYKNGFLRHIVCVPFIYVMIIPFVFLDVLLEIYHRITFRILNLRRVKRSAYIKIDRHKLKRLNFIEKINCAYCGYANGLVRYASEIGARSEKYWCAIRHQKSKEFIEPKYQKLFENYNNS